MKPYLRIPLIIVLDVVVFFAAGYAHVFESVFWSMLIKFSLGLLLGIVLYRFFRDNSEFWMGLLFMLFLIGYFLYPFSTNDVYYRLPANSFLVMGMLSGYYWAKLGRMGRVIVPLLIIAFGYVNLGFIYPRLISLSESGEKSVLVGKSMDAFLAGARLQPDTAYTGTPFPKGKVYLLEFYFDRCPPCRMKHPALQKIAAMTDKDEFEIIYVDNGKIDKLDDFYRRWSSTEKQYYDSAALLTRSLGIRNFPFEVIIDKEGVIQYVSKGYDKDKQDVYVEEAMRRIESLQ